MHAFCTQKFSNSPHNDTAPTTSRRVGAEACGGGQMLIAGRTMAAAMTAVARSSDFGNSFA
jgi:hypothetical protein